jgi:non-specific serine/threonine protein kinase/serine/threonine-protein kinase
VAETETWGKLKEIFAGALERPADERSAYLDAVCGRDSSLRTELESLLSAYESSNGLSKPSWLDSSQENSCEGKTIGPYQLVRKLGEGGMGQVWLAQQTAPVQRQVALKLIRGSMYDEAARRRFQLERQSLAIMDHPAIAKVFDAGATADGQLFFVMEYVPGLVITDYCDQKKLGIRKRLELFIEVCDGVQHALQKAVIHRDLKPANILVVEVDGKPKPRLIDFGLAKAVTPLGGQTLFTQTGILVGTPGYMSPEQANPGDLDVDTRTDVYSLGVVLYELLTGSLPFDTSKKRPVDEMLRQLREEDPPRPSAKLSSDPATAAAAAAGRGTDPKQLVNDLHGDLDGITMKAIERERERRYGTPSELAADIQRYLNHEAVKARPASAQYRIQKYLRRHRLGVAVAGVILVLLASFAVAQAIQLRRTTRERDRAARITDFMTSMFKVSDPGEARGNSITVREMLDKASNDIGTGLAKDPELQAQLMDVMGTVYERLGLYGRAQPLYEQAADIQRRVLGPEHPDTLRTSSNLGWILQRNDHFTESEKLLRQTLDAQRRVVGPERLDTLRTMNNLGGTLFQEYRFTEAEKLFREALETERRVLGPENSETIRSTGNLGMTLGFQGKNSESEKVLRDLLDIERRVYGPNRPETLKAISDLAMTLDNEGNYPEAEKLQREALDTERRVLGPDHPVTLYIAGNLGFTLNLEGQYKEAEKVYRETLDADRRVFGPENPSTLLVLHSLAVVLTNEGQYDEAESLLRTSIDTMRRVLAPENPLRAVSLYSLGLVMALRGHKNEALSLLREAVDHGLSAASALGIEKNANLKSLHGDPRFAALVEHAKQLASLEQQSK